jgi:amino acid transporter
LFATTVFWYAGFDNIPQAMGEMKGSTQAIPKVIVAAIGGAAIFYILVILGSAVALPRDELLGSELAPAAAFASVVKAEAAGKIVLFAGLLGLISTWNAVFFSASRVIFASGRAQFIPALFGASHRKYGSPANAVLFVGFVAACGTFIGRNAIIPIIAATSICFSLIFLLMCIGVLRLRMRAEPLGSAYRVPGGVSTVIGAASVALGMLMISLFGPLVTEMDHTPTEWLLLGIWMLLGLVFWNISRFSRTEMAEETRRWLILGDAHQDISTRLPD